MIAVVLLAAAACSAPSIVRMVRARELALVEEGRYRYHVETSLSSPKLQARAASWREEIEDEPGFLRTIGEKYFSIPRASSFGLMYSGEDTAHRTVILRYFAYDPKPVIMAGWQIQFVFDRASGRLQQVYACEVPLE